ncbi:MAG: hypothetical protein R3E44_12275 [Paracoccaceae bacterium]
MQKIGLILVFATMAAALSGCGPVIVGAGGAVIADKVAEDQQGDDGLF